MNLENAGLEMKSTLSESTTITLCYKLGSRGGRQPEFYESYDELGVTHRCTTERRVQQSWS